MGLDESVTIHLVLPPTNPGFGYPFLPPGEAGKATWAVTSQAPKEDAKKKEPRPHITNMTKLPLQGKTPVHVCMPSLFLSLLI